MVELNPDFDEGEAADARRPTASARLQPEAAHGRPRRGRASEAAPATRQACRQAADAGRRRCATASTRRRRPVVGDVLRGRDQRALADVPAQREADLRAADSGFDERRYGFGGLMDLLRACQRDGLMRLERDRRGGLRVFQGAALAARDRCCAGADSAMTLRQPVEPVQPTPKRTKATASRSSSGDADLRRSTGRRRSTRPPNCSGAPSPGGRARQGRAPKSRAKTRAAAAARPRKRASRARRDRGQVADACGRHHRTIQ